MTIVGLLRELSPSFAIELRKNLVWRGPFRCVSRSIGFDRNKEFKVRLKWSSIYLLSILSENTDKLHWPHMINSYSVSV